MFTGKEVNITQHQAHYPQAGATRKEIQMWRWPVFCHESQLSVPVKGREGRVRVAPLLDYTEDDLFARYTIGIPSVFTQDGFRSNLVERLTGSVPWKNPVLGYPRSDEGYDVMTVSYAKFELPDYLEFDPSMVEGFGSDVVYLGVMVEGSPLLWDLTDHPHGLFCGATGSGKTIAAKLALAQLLREGWEVRVATPTEKDATFAGFEGHPNFRGFYGSSPDALVELARELVGEDEEMSRREEEMGEVAQAEVQAGRKGVTCWGDPAGSDREPYGWLGRKSFWFVDEYTDLIIAEPDDEKEVVAAKKVIQTKLRKRVLRGRKVRQHTGIAVQQPDVAAFGEGATGGRVLRNLDFRLAVTSLSRQFAQVVFDGTESESVKMLWRGGNPKGRGIARGAVVPDNEFGTTTNDGAVQIPYLDDDSLRELILNDGPVSPVVEAAEAILIEQGDSRVVESGDGGVSEANWLTGPKAEPVPPAQTISGPVEGLKTAVVPTGPRVSAARRFDATPASWSILEPGESVAGEFDQPAPLPDGVDMPVIPVNDSGSVWLTYAAAACLFVVLWVAVFVGVLVL